MVRGNDRKRINVDLGNPELYRALKYAAIERSVPARQIVVEALTEWLDRHQFSLGVVQEEQDGR